ncbi:MAG TPA: response regulator [Anaerolineaceae bacterium]|nr:response regulator [Anaerolineaceae bacterium]
MKNVMIVDDSLELGRLLQASLMVLDPTLKVMVVPSAEEAILESSRNPMDLLVTDIRLPGISGIDLVRKIRARRPVVKVMLITGLSDANLNQQVKELSVDAFFRKPLEIPDFLEAARNCLGLSSDAPEMAARAEREIKAAAEPEVKPKKKHESQPTREKRMAQELLDVLPEATPIKTLSDILTDLRHRLGALAALILDERGRVLAQAGEPPDDGFIEKVASAWMGLHAPSLTLGSLLKPGSPQMVQAFRGEKFDFLFTPVGLYSLGVILVQGKSALRLALAFETVLEETGELAEVLGVDSIQPVSVMQPQLGVEETQVALPAFLEDEIPPQNEPPLGEFLSALQNQPAAPVDADSFWDNSDVPPAVVSTPDMLTYDQAMQLGLAPEDKPA